MNHSEQIRKSIETVVREIIKKETKDCFRIYKAKVITAPNGTTCTVQLIGDSTQLTIPYSSKCADVTANQFVWIAAPYGFRNAIVCETVNFK